MFVPIHDINPLEHIRRPYVTWAIALANVLVFLFFQRAAFGEVDPAGLISYGAIPAVLTGEARLPDGYEHLPAWTSLLTYMFLHAGWFHIIGNMAFLLVFGDNVEDAMGHVRFLVFYVLCGLAAAGAHILAAPDAQSPLVGASGACSGVMAAYVMLHPNIRLWALVLMKIPLRIPAVWIIVAWIALQIFQASTKGDAVTAWWAHVGGVVAGMLLVTVMRRPGVALFDRDPSGVPSPRPSPQSER